MCVCVRACLCNFYTRVCVFSNVQMLSIISDEYITSQHSHFQDFTYLKVNMLDSEEETQIDHYQKCASFIYEGI